MKTRSFICSSENCFKSFRDEKSFCKHQKTHEPKVMKDPKDFTCSKCGRVLATKQSWKEHGFIHLEKRPFRCSEIGCGKMFRQSSQLCNHRKVHKEAKKLMKKISENENSLNFFAEKMSHCFMGEKNRVVLPPLHLDNWDIVLPKLENFK